MLTSSPTTTKATGGLRERETNYIRSPSVRLRLITISLTIPKPQRKLNVNRWANHSGEEGQSCPKSRDRPSPGNQVTLCVAAACHGDTLIRWRNQRDNMRRGEANPTKGVRRCVDRGRNNIVSLRVMFRLYKRKNRLVDGNIHTISQNMLCGLYIL